MNVKEFFKSSEFKDFVKQLLVGFLGLLATNVQARFLQSKQSK